jgi:hypothetical protein
MKERIFPIIIALSALSVSASAAFYSVFGLSHLFAGASTQVIIMAGALEVAKLVVASLLYQYWDSINKILRTYFVIATFVLMVITSGGIYGYLSGAYQETSTQSEFMDKQVAIIELKQDRFEETKSDLKVEKAALTKSISDLRIALSNPTSVSYYSEEAEQVITTTSSSARRALQTELKTSITERDQIDTRLNAITDSIAKLDVNILDAQINNESARELGPLKYMAELTNQPMATIVNWFMILIIFVFDPLAIAMVVAANMAFANIKGVARDPKDYEVYKKKIKVKMSVPEGKEFNTPYSMEPTPNIPSDDLKQRVKESQEKLKSKEEPKPEPKSEPKVEAHEEIDPRFKGALDKAITHIRRAGIKIPNKFWRRDQ